MHKNIVFFKNWSSRWPTWIMNKYISNSQGDLIAYGLTEVASWWNKMN